jgi:hypothetical protein
MKARPYTDAEIEGAEKWYGDTTAQRWLATVRRLRAEVRTAALDEAMAALEVTCATVLTMDIVPQEGPTATKQIRDAIHYGALRAIEDVRKLRKEEP